MKELSKFVCEFCHTEYKNVSDCMTCEANHKTPVDTKKCAYKPITIDRSGYPLTVSISFDDGEVITYKRG